MTSTPQIARPSVASLYLVLQRSGEQLGTATGFVVEREGRAFLVTNRHVVLGKGKLPDAMVVVHNKAGALGSYEQRVELLYDKEGEPLWYEHPTHAADVAVLPLTRTDGVDLHGHDPWPPETPGRVITVSVSDALHIIGFPFGIAGGGFLGVWVRGFVATEPDIDWQGMPCFLIDSRTRQGQSGSPVIAYANGPYNSGGGLVVGGGPVERFYGVYSGRINAESDLGVVWKAVVVSDVIEAKQRATKASVAASFADLNEMDFG